MCTQIPGDLPTVVCPSLGRWNIEYKQSAPVGVVETRFDFNWRLRRALANISWVAAE